MSNVNREMKTCKVESKRNAKNKKHSSRNKQCLQRDHQ